MNDNYINVVEAAKELGLQVKLVTAVKSFDTYNSFFNIYGEEEEPCRRIVILTSDSEIEEVYDEDPGKAVDKIEKIEGNIWVREFPLTFNPKNIKFEDIVILKEDLEKLKQLK